MLYTFKPTSLLVPPGASKFFSTNSRKPIFSTSFFFTGILSKFRNAQKIAKNSGGGQNFKQANVERPIFGNKKIANVKRYEIQLFDFFIYEIIFLFFLNYLNTQIFFVFFFNFNARIFYNFPNLIFFNLKFFF